MTDLETLQECRMATMEEKALSKQLDRLRLICGPQGVASQALEIAGDRKTNNSQAASIQRLEGLIEQLSKKREENLEIIQRAEAVISRIIARRDRVVIRYYYVEGQSEYEIADEMDVSRQWVNQRRSVVIDTIARNKKISRDGQNILI